MFSRGKQFVRQHSVVGDQEKSFCILVKTAYRKKSLPVRWYIFHDSSVVSVFCCTDAARRLIQKIIDKLRCRTNRLTCKHDYVFVLIDFKLRFLRRCSVDLNLTFLYKFLYFTSGSLPCIRKKFIQSYCFCHNHSSFCLTFQTRRATCPNCLWSSGRLSLCLRHRHCYQKTPG